MCFIRKHSRKFSPICAVLNNGGTSFRSSGTRTSAFLRLTDAPLWDRGRVILASPEGAASARKGWHRFDR
jgi:hypothetical protein